MTWEIFTVVRDNLLNNVFGSYMLLALFLLFVMMIILMSVGVNPLLAFILVVPAFLGMAVAGWFGANTWIKAAIYIIIGVIWTFIIWRFGQE